MILARGKALPWRAFPKDYATLAKVIWGQFDLNAVSDHGADAGSPHPARCIGNDLVAVVEMDAKAPFREYFLDKAIQCKNVFFRQSSGGFELGRRSAATLVRLDLVAYALVLEERGHSGLLDRADVHEAVITAAVGRDEAIAFVGIEEFYGADGHENFPLENSIETRQHLMRWQRWPSVKGRIRPKASKSVAGDDSPRHMGLLCGKVNERAWWKHRACSPAAPRAHDAVV